MEQLNPLFYQYKLPIILIIVGLVLITGGLFTSGLFDKPRNYPEASFKESQSGLIKVDISGAVQNPSVYTLTVNSRIEDVIRSAGGFKENANKEYISKALNLSQKLSDGHKIYIPFEKEDIKTLPSSEVVGAVTTALIGLNSASQSKLESLPGVGPATALKIISGRPYTQIDYLITKKIISKAVFEKIKNLVDLN